MGYDSNGAMVRVDFFQKSGKWYTTEAVKWLTWDGNPNEGGKLIFEAFAEALRHNDTAIRLGEDGMFAVCLEPYHEHSHPIILWKW